ncbi:hypothetical protein BJ165DRAFT_1589395 [Panaeolus papilionaceus]|nr:hypothetical protein BJ165DRAFT_1589395 [Panaeolus papilionaceus]
MYERVDHTFNGSPSEHPAHPLWFYYGSDMNQGKHHAMDIMASTPSVAPSKKSPVTLLYALELLDKFLSLDAAMHHFDCRRGMIFAIKSQSRRLSFSSRNWDPPRSPELVDVSFNTRGRILHAVKRILPCAPGVVSKALYLEGDRCINLVEEHSSPQGIGSLITHGAYLYPNKFKGSWEHNPTFKTRQLSEYIVLEGQSIRNLIHITLCYTLHPQISWSEEDHTFLDSTLDSALNERLDTGPPITTKPSNHSPIYHVTRRPQINTLHRWHTHALPLYWMYERTPFCLTGSIPPVQQSCFALKKPESECTDNDWISELYYSISLAAKERLILADDYAVGGKFWAMSWCCSRKRETTPAICLMGDPLAHPLWVDKCLCPWRTGKEVFDMSKGNMDDPGLNSQSTAAMLSRGDRSKGFAVSSNVKLTLIIIRNNLSLRLITCQPQGLQGYRNGVVFRAPAHYALKGNPGSSEGYFQYRQQLFLAFETLSENDTKHR